MNTIRLNITLPTDLGRQVRASKNYSALIAEALRAKFAKDEADRLNQLLAKGYQARARQDAALNAEFDHMTRDGLE
jgi:post-segregation antitoxin (ccd killing protein)